MSEPLPEGELSINEFIKADSDYLRGDIAESLENQITMGVGKNAMELMKFHGIYLQDDRDIREERDRKKLEPAYSFMVRVPIPGGILTPEQWLALDHIATTIGSGSIRLTTRQAIQFHQVLRPNLRQLMQTLDKVSLCTLNGCGDITRNVMNSAEESISPVHREAQQCVNVLQNALRAKTNAWREIWLNEKKKKVGKNENEEPLYGPTYMPRKFKITMVVPPDNDTDVFAHDIGLIAIAEGNNLLGFNVSVGGGLGMTHGDKATYPQLGKIIGFCNKDQLLPLCEAIIGIQRDYGDRKNRKHARMKYTIDDRGLEWFVLELASRLSWNLLPEKPVSFTSTGDHYGWLQRDDSLWNFCLLIENGRIIDKRDHQLLTGLRELASLHKGNFTTTPNQNLIICGIEEADKPKIIKIIEHFNLNRLQNSLLNRHALACVALPTCPQAMAEAERYLPHLLDKIEKIMDEIGLTQREIKIRMTGCPNGCARPYMAEIGLVGRAPGKYNVYLGGSWIGDRLNKLYLDNIDEARILSELRPLFIAYRDNATEGERFGDFVIRAGYVAAVYDGRSFHEK